MTTWYTSDHEWISVDGDVGTVGISAFASDKLGDVVFVDLPEIGRKVKKEGEMAVVESVKAASDVYAPVAGEVIEVNSVLTDAPETVNADPEGKGWFCKIKIADPSQLDGLMDKAAYAAWSATQ
jgi:glycine cleavage system H protein